MKADFNLSARFPIQESSEQSDNKQSVLTDIILPKNYPYLISSKPVKKKHNRFFSGDNLDAMTQLLEEGYGKKFDLIYIDPPYFSQSSYSHNIKVPMREKIKTISQKTYADNWNSIDEYLSMLYPRLVLMKKLLSDKGSIFVHLDWRVSHYVKILLDEIFGFENFRNEIAWCYYGPSSPKSRQFNREHQNILWYSKSATNWNFFADKIRMPYKKSTLQKVNSLKNGFKGSIHDFTKGKIPEDWWTDIPLAQRYRYEVTDFETQKPKKLLERIIKATTKEGDLIGDFFCGSGTTAVVAEELERRWITADSSLLSMKIAKSRLAKVLKKPILVERYLGTQITRQKVKTSLSKKKLDNKTLLVRIKNYSNYENKNIKKLSKSLSHFSYLIDSWAVDWNFDGNVFRASWEEFRANRNEVKPVAIGKEYKFKNEISERIAVKLVDIFGNETLRTLRC